MHHQIQSFELQSFSFRILNTKQCFFELLLKEFVKTRKDNDFSTSLSTSCHRWASTNISPDKGSADEDQIKNNLSQIDQLRRTNDGPAAATAALVEGDKMIYKVEFIVIIVVIVDIII